MRKRCNTRKDKLIAIVSFLILVMIMVNTASAAIVEVVSPGKLPVQLHEGEHIDLSIKISDYQDSKQLTLETNLIPESTDKPLWDFGDSNPIIDVNRYQQKIALNLSSFRPFLMYTFLVMFHQERLLLNMAILFLLN